MNAIATPFRQLAAGRLWPIALILALAAAATPLLLADREELPPVPATTAVPAGMNALQAALVSPASARLEERRRVLGARKDPFTPTGDQPEPPKAPPSATAAPTQTSTTASASPGSGLGSPSGGSGSGGAPVSSDPMTSPSPGAGTPPATPVPNPQPVAPVTGDAPARSFALYSLKVRVNGQVRTLKRLDALPNAEAPAAIYLGLHEDGKTAVFLVDEGVTAEGDGRCDPNPDDCQRVFLRKGETEFFTAGAADGAQGTELQVDLLSVRTKRTKSAGKARVARMASSSVGRNLLRDRMSRVGRLRYNPRTGLLRELSLDGWRALVARAASRP